MIQNDGMSLVVHHIDGGGLALGGFGRDQVKLLEPMLGECVEFRFLDRVDGSFEH